MKIFPQVWVKYASTNTRVDSWGLVLIKPFVDDIWVYPLFLEDPDNNTVLCEENV